MRSRFGGISGRITAGRVIASAVALVATGFLFAAGYDIYSRVFKKAAPTPNGSMGRMGAMGIYIPEPKVQKFSQFTGTQYFS